MIFTMNVRKLWWHNRQMILFWWCGNFNASPIGDDTWMSYKIKVMIHEFNVRYWWWHLNDWFLFWWWYFKHRFLFWWCGNFNTSPGGRRLATKTIGQQRGSRNIHGNNSGATFFWFWWWHRNQNPSDDMPIIALLVRSMNWGVYFVMIFWQTSHSKMKKLCWINVDILVLMLLR